MLLVMFNELLGDYTVETALSEKMVLRMRYELFDNMGYVKKSVRFDNPNKKGRPSILRCCDSPLFLFE